MLCECVLPPHPLLGTYPHIDDSAFQNVYVQTRIKDAVEALFEDNPCLAPRVIMPEDKFLAVLKGQHFNHTETLSQSIMCSFLTPVTYRMHGYCRRGAFWAQQRRLSIHSNSQVCAKNILKQDCTRICARAHVFRL